MRDKRRDEDQRTAIKGFALDTHHGGQVLTMQQAPCFRLGSQAHFPRNGAYATDSGQILGV